MTQLSEHVSVKDTEMAEVLANIIKDKRIWVQKRQNTQPLESFQSGLSRSDRDFYHALSQPNKTAFLLECKKASPSKGLIRKEFDLDYIAGVYSRHASAISVLTDEKYFQGDFEFLPQVRKIASQPILCKDFVIDSYQVYLARHYSADAILLMLSVLSDEEYRCIAQVAHELGMGVLTEISNEHELQRAVDLKAKVIGINNRNLRDLSTDLNRTETLAPKVRQQAPDAIIISESGIYTHQQVKQLTPYADGFLVGSALMAEDDLELAVRKLTLGHNKVCGLTRPEDAQNAYQAGAVFGGLIFAEKSKRCITEETANTIMQSAPLSYVGVFQNQSIEQVVGVANRLQLSAIQLHGHEDLSYIKKVRSQLDAHIEIWKAYPVESSLPSLIKTHVDRHLLDAKVGQQLGGTGQSFDWSLLENEALTNKHSIMLAGGLAPHNVHEAAQLGCIGLDFNSGVESAPGQKDLAKLLQVFAALRDY